MNQEYLDFNSYTFVGGFPVPSGKDLIIPASLQLSQTMLVKWQIRQLVKGGTIDQISSATLSATLEIVGLGILEAEEYQINPSQQGKDRVQLITLDPSLPYKLTLSNIDNLVTNSVLEFYTSDLNMANFNNPVSASTDLSPLIAAIEAGSNATVATIQSAASQPIVTKQVTKLDEFEYTATVWSGNASTHIAIDPDSERMRIHILNKSNKKIAVDQFYDIGTKAATPQHDGVIDPGGSYTVEQDEAGMGILLYLLSGSATGLVEITLSR